MEETSDNRKGLLAARNRRLFFINPTKKKEMKEVKVVFHDDDIRCTVILPNGGEKVFTQVSAMLNWCAENNYQPVVGKEACNE